MTVLTVLSPFSGNSPQMFVRLRIYTDKNRSPGDCLSENPETEGEHGAGENKDLAVRGWYPEFRLDV